MRSALLRRRALGEPEVSDTRAPVKAGRATRVIFVGVVKGAVVGWIDIHVAIVAPTVACSGLTTTTGEQRRFTLGEVIDRIGECLSFAQNERVHTENSYKYSPTQIRGLANDAGFV